MNKLSVLDIAISTGKYADFVRNIVSAAYENKGQYVCVANVHMLIEARKDPSFAKILHNAKVVTPDGMPLTWAMRLLHRYKQDRVAGMDLLPDLLQQASDRKLGVFFYGGTEEMIDNASVFLRNYFPNLHVSGMYSPPFRDLSEDEEMAVADMINASGASMIFVALGCPKQEKWMSGMKGKIKAEMIGIGGSLPVMIGMQKRAPLWMQRTGLEWLYRFLQEPKRLFKRYAVTNTRFVVLMVKEMLRQRSEKGSMPGRFRQELNKKVA